MSELKAFESERIYWAVEQVERVAGDIDSLHLDDNLFYIKSEADKVIAYHKYKRCLAMAKWCESKVYHIRRTPLCDMDEHEGWQHDDEFWQRWHKRWLELAEKFKEGV